MIITLKDGSKKEYLSQGFMEKQMEQIQRNQYTQLLLKQLGQKVNLPVTTVSISLALITAFL